MSKRQVASTAAAATATVAVLVAFVGMDPQDRPTPVQRPSSSASCKYRAGGELPDARCTPGAIDPEITVGDLCPHLGPRVKRAVSQPTKDAVKAEYGQPLSFGADGTGEIDHLVSLELGGLNDVSNLWPQAGKRPNKKDAIENRLHAKVCNGDLTLAQAQIQLLTDWRQIS